MYIDNKQIGTFQQLLDVLLDWVFIREASSHKYKSFDGMKKELSCFKSSVSTGLSHTSTLLNVALVHFLQVVQDLQ